MWFDQINKPPTSQHPYPFNHNKIRNSSVSGYEKSVAAFILQHEKKPVVVVLSLALKIVSCKFEDKSLMKIQTEMNEKLML